jgi:hypothetical protein
MNLAGIDFGSTLITAGGFIGSDVAAGYVTQMLPAGWQTPVARLGVKVAIGVGAPMLLRKFLGARTANLIAAGAVLSAAVDAYHLWVAPMIGLHGYEVGMTNYAPLSGVHEDAQLGGGENIYGDTIY